MSRMDRYSYNEYKTGRTGTDEIGKYEIIQVVREQPCGCHPETCTHFSESVTVKYDKKIYIKALK